MTRALLSLHSRTKAYGRWYWHSARTPVLNSPHYCSRGLCSPTEGSSGARVAGLAAYSREKHAVASGCLQLPPLPSSLSSPRQTM